MEDYDHWRGFADFVAFEGAAGGPSPNLNLISAVGEQAKGRNRVELAWLACCYAAIYNTPGSALLWSDWPIRDMRGENLEERVTVWIEENKDGIPVHSNRRRTHGGAARLARGMVALSEFAHYVAESPDFERGDDYERLWSQVNSIHAVGRYFGIKLAGTLERLGLTEARQYDIRARGAKNGRRTLALLFPDYATDLELKTGGNSAQAITLAEGCATNVKQWLLDSGLDVNWFQLEALLCEYNQMVKGHRYPGSTSDGDLEALMKVQKHWGAEHPAVDLTKTARYLVLPEELRWTRKRKDMLDIYQTQRYVWSDAVYVRPPETSKMSSTNFISPEVKSEPTTEWTPLTRPKETLEAS